MILPKERASLVLRAAVLGAVAVAGLAACTRSQVTEVNCVEVAGEQPGTTGGESAPAQVCDQQRVRIVHRDALTEEEVVSNKTW